MPSSFVSEPLTPLGGSFDTALMAQGEPGLPQRFRWRSREWHIATVLEKWKDHGDCRNGSDERYVRRHVFRVQTEEGPLLQIYFQRTMGRSSGKSRLRWWVYSVEENAPVTPRRSPPADAG
jgi:hypothetical protein